MTVPATPAALAERLRYVVALLAATKMELPMDTWQDISRTMLEAAEQLARPATPPAAAPEAGFVRVPDRLTDEQADAAWEAVRSDQFTYLRKNLSIHSVRLLIREIYRAMLAAAPPPPPSDGEKG